MINALRRLLRHFSRPARTSPPARGTVRLSLETLEDRTTPSTLTVPTAAYPTIQSAVDHAHANDTIFVQPGTYPEQVTIKSGLNGLTLTSVQNGKPDATIAPTNLTGVGAVIVITGSTHVTINDFNITGDTTTQYGIRVVNGSSAVITNNHITNILGSNGAGIDVGDRLAMTTGTAQIENNTVSGYTSVGIVVDNAKSYAEIEDNTIVGRGSAVTAPQFGIQISFGANAEVEENDVSNNTFHSSNDSAGIFTFQCGDDTEIENNYSHGNEFGIFITGSNGVEVSDNTASNNTNDGIQLLDSSNCRISDNCSSHNMGDGISIYGDPKTTGPANNNTVVDNTIHDNKGNGITIDAANNNTIKDNAINNNGGSCIAIDPLTPNSSSGNRISDNCTDSNHDGDHNGDHED